MEKYLFQQLFTFNNVSENKYRDQWGSILSFIEEKRTTINGEVLEPEKVFKLQMMQRRLQMQSKLTSD
jgi:hypothetical protein